MKRPATGPQRRRPTVPPTRPSAAPPLEGGGGPARPEPEPDGVSGVARVAEPGGAPAVPGPPRQPVRYAALGDSLTEGVGDPVPGGWRGWAALLATGLSAEGSELLNTACSGALGVDVAERQLPLAREHRPQVASVVVGVNDTLRDTFDIGRFAGHLDTVLRSFREDGTTVLTACLPDPGRMLGLPALLARPLARRMQAVNTVVHALSTRHDALHLHAADRPWVADRAAWSVDRLHPSELGHRILAREFHALLARSGLADGPPPPTEPDAVGPGVWAEAWWMATRGTRWVVARCQDLLPDLLRLAAAEARHRLDGTSGVLDLRSHRAALHA
ncbi:SGNH/GDSL hydrolase family protein, partial [Streptomyces sp. 8N706]|uniref:SGNH/GDSL hydrolase family protein n=1 Tax=Streptomyces sp. 8N706 TaxID=3457416 RepID=UPI003FD235DE